MARNTSANMTYTPVISERNQFNERLRPCPNSTLRREDFGDTSPSPSQTSGFFDYFENDPEFWKEAAEITQPKDEIQADTPPTSITTVTSASDSSFNLDLHSFIKLPTSNFGSNTGLSARLKRKASQASIASGCHSRASKIARVASSDQLTTFIQPPSAFCEHINLSPPQNLQGCIDSRKLPYSVQWELARLVTKGVRNWEGERVITIEELDRLRPEGDSKRRESEGAKKITKVFGNDYLSDPHSHLFEDERKATDPWTELEREDEFIATHQDSRLLAENDWYGGKVHFTATLKRTTNNKLLTIADYKIELDPAERATSNSFSRRFGSKAFLRLKVPKNVLNKPGPLIDYLRKPIILCQSVFRAFYAKEQTVFYFRTNEVWNAKTQTISTAPPSSPGMDLIQFIQWHNPTEYNCKQTMAKWASRFALGLSSSVPGMTLDEKDIFKIEDIKSEQGSDMTDGAGYIHRHLLQKLTKTRGWDCRPSAIQVRVMGSKGLLVDHPESCDENIGIQLRPSLIKTKYPCPLDVAHRTIDILRPAHARSPIRISTDIIINLHENGVRAEVIKNLLKQSLEEVVQPLLDWDSNDPSAARRLWVHFERSGSVVRSRRAREEVAEARAKGYTARDITEEVDDDEDTYDLDENMERSSDWWPDRVSGSPSCLEETVMAFLDSGFRPPTCTVLREKAFIVVQKMINRVVASCTIEIPQSAGAWIVPDPTGLLQPDRVFFRSSQPKLLAQDGTETDIITGEVLIMRDPCRLPTDVQKWKAVDIPELHYLKDVIVLSVQGPRRAADWLAGGDYDGDKVKLIWQPELVRDFRNADAKFADPPEELDSFFKEENERVDEFLERTRDFCQEQMLSEMQRYLLGIMEDPMMVGMYSTFHEYSTYTKGYSSEQTKLLAYMFTTVLDGRKTGKTVRPEIFKEHRSRFTRKLFWKEAGRKKRNEGEFVSDHNTPFAKRDPCLRGRSFIMDDLVAYGKILKGELLGDLAKRKEGYKHEANPELVQPYQEAKQRVERLRLKNASLADIIEAELALIERHVEAIYEEHGEVQRQAGASAEYKRQTPTSGAGFTNIPIGKRQDILRGISKRFHSGPLMDAFQVLSEHDVGRIRASYAYHYDLKQKPGQPSRFPWNVAFRDLCALKCGQNMKPIDQNFYDHLNMKEPKRPKTAP